jgi:hypothetical protein
MVHSHSARICCGPLSETAPGSTRPSVLRVGKPGAPLVSKRALLLKEEGDEAHKQGEVGERPDEELHARSIACRGPDRMTVS